MSIIQKKGRKFYLDICMGLSDKYPDEILPLYWRDVHTLF